MFSTYGAPERRLRRQGEVGGSGFAAAIVDAMTTCCRGRCQEVAKYYWCGNIGEVREGS
jgi:hypothetical protein